MHRFPPLNPPLSPGNQCCSKQYVENAKSEEILGRCRVSLTLDPPLGRNSRKNARKIGSKEGRRKNYKKKKKEKRNLNGQGQGKRKRKTSTLIQPKPHGTRQRQPVSIPPEAKHKTEKRKRKKERKKKREGGRKKGAEWRGKMGIVETLRYPAVPSLELRRINGGGVPSLRSRNPWRGR